MAVYYKAIMLEQSSFRASGLWSQFDERCTCGQSVPGLQLPRCASSRAQRMQFGAYFACRGVLVTGGRKQGWAWCFNACACKSHLGPARPSAPQRRLPPLRRMPHIMCN